MKLVQIKKYRILILPLVFILLTSCGDKEDGSTQTTQRRRAQGLPFSPQPYSITLMEADNGWKIHDLSIAQNGEAIAQVEDSFGSSSEYRGQGFIGGDAASVKLIMRVVGYTEYLPPAGIMLDLNGTIRPGCFNATGAFLSSYEDNTIFLNVRWENLPETKIHWGDLQFTDRVELRFPEC